jgi:3'-phosphoadenosine 5'-phosphosulfate sulfotransferase (PAPS reductase)/FAD synthetase
MKRLPEPTIELFIDHDPLNPHPEEPTPLDMVMRLTRPQREKRAEKLIELADRRFYEAVEMFIHRQNRTLHSVCLLYSGGKDSSTVAALFRDRATHILHANTGTGIQATRDFVANTAKEWGLPLIMEKSGDDYFDMVLGRLRNKNGEIAWRGGFPGAGAHPFVQQRLKERALDRAKHTLGISGSRTHSTLWVSGRRRPESRQRASIPHYESDGPVVFNCPLTVWHKADLTTVRLMHGKTVPVNPTAVKLGMSGECGCLANAHPGERDMWFREFPDDPFLQRILETEEELQKPEYAHIPNHMKRWGWNAEKADVRPEVVGRLCGPDCGPDPLLDMMDPLFGVAS